MFARSPEAGRRRPCVIIAHSDPVYAVGAARAFRRHGWVPLLAADGPQARQLAAECPGSLVVLEADLPGESGWLTCAKLSLARPRYRIVLVAANQDECDDSFAEFAGAARLVMQDQGLDPLLEMAGIGLPLTQAV